jgi:hypothetical protein
MRVQFRFGLLLLLNGACEREPPGARIVQWEYARLTHATFPYPDLAVSLPDIHLRQNSAQWKTRIGGNDSTLMSAFQVFQALGREGWEMVGCVQGPGVEGSYICDFKRPKR